MKRFALTLLLSLALASAALAQDQSARVIVVFSGDPDPSVVTNAGGQVLFTLDTGHAIVSLVPVPQVANIQANPKVAYVEPDGEAQASGQTTSWGVSKIGAGTVWTTSTGSGVTVAIIDTGIQNDHPDLSPRVTLGPTYVTGTSTSKDDNGHGTHVAGIIGASNNTIGVVGVAPGCSLLAVKVLDRTGRGYYSSIISGIDYASDPALGNAKVISMSLGGKTDSQAVHDACDRAVYLRGVVVCVAAGNDGGGSNAVSYPGAYDSVICVAATDSNDAWATFSTYGLQVDVAAPGVSINSTYTKGTYKVLSGTSMATPHVSGTAALLIASGLISDRSLVTDVVGYGFINDEVRKRIEQTSTQPLNRTDKLGYGRISASAAISAGPN